MSEHELWNELGNLYFLSGSYGQAVHAYRRSIQIDDTFGRPYSNLALTYVQQGKFDEAVDLYRRSIELLIENNEKAISWNRLGNVYRYLKDYQSALMAYQKADELDPENGESDDRPGWVSETAAKAQPDREVDIVFPAEAPPQPFQAEDTVPSTDQSAVTTEDFIASWALTELSPYQQNVSASPDTNPLTTWGAPNFEEGADPFAAPDPDADVEVPDIDGDDLTKWLPIPEEAPQDMIQAGPDLEEAVQEIEEAPVEEADMPMPELPVEEPTETIGPAAPTPEPVSTPEIVPSIVFRREITDRLDHVEQAVEAQVAVEVEERPTPDFVYAVSQTVETVTEMQMAKDEPPMAQAPAAAGEAGASADAAEETVSPDLAAEIERTAEEMRKMQTDIAKYRRVVQVNPRNAHAWDTLGNLYKSAGQYSESLTAYQQAVATDPGRALYHHHLGLLYACLGRTEDAICAFQRVIEIDPGHSLAHATLGGYYRKMGLEELAQKHIGKAMKSIFDSENEYNRACLAAICGNADEALELLRVALRNKQTYVDWILRDPDLDFIRQDPRFRQLISDYTR
jgi:tetratricopeptide (TPR) repeat protein